ncbi:hypothetical protein [Neptuniibacter sp. QD37_11]|uniref:hypothetical protein n=1 Tax=Neptuniibacter sp. QD37_11 TaxID=3398209 RepID=UPI0039F5ABA5
MFKVLNWIYKLPLGKITVTAMGVSMACFGAAAFNVGNADPSTAEYERIKAHYENNGSVYSSDLPESIANVREGLQAGISMTSAISDKIDTTLRKQN